MPKRIRQSKIKQKEEDTKKSNKLIEIVKIIRDNLLFVASILYALGYIVWAFNAWQNNLGLLPALDFQYLVAGIFPAIVIAIYIIIIWYFIVLRRNVLIWFGPHAHGWKIKVRQIVPPLLAVLNYLILIILVIAFIYTYYDFSLPIVLIEIFYIILIMFGISIFLLPPDMIPSNFGLRYSVKQIFAIILNRDYQSESDKRKIDSCLGVQLKRFKVFIESIPKLFFGYITLWSYGIIFIIAFLMFMLLFSFFQSELYPNLPQEFGGIKPRCAYIDVEKNKLSSRTQDAILPNVESDPQDEIVATERLQIFFIGSQFLLASPENNSEIIEIERSVVQAISWCKY